MLWGQVKTCSPQLGSQRRDFVMGKGRQGLGGGSGGDAEKLGRILAPPPLSKPRLVLVSCRPTGGVDGCAL